MGSFTASTAWKKARKKELLHTLKLNHKNTVNCFVFDSDKLVEEQEAASHHSLVAEELRRTCAQQELQIAKLKESERTALDQLELTKKELCK